MQLPRIGESLTQEHVDFLKVFTKSCRGSIVEMVKNSQSGHPGGSCSVIDYLALLYCFIVSQSGEDVVVSNGHVSPAVYTILGHMGYIPLEDAVRDFRKVGSIYEGHITRHVAGVTYGPGPLGVGVSAASGFALAEKLNNTGKHTFGVLGDGESDEGQVYEMMHFANKYKLSDYILFMDYNKVQLSGSLADVMPINPKETFPSDYVPTLNRIVTKLSDAKIELVLVTSARAYKNVDPVKRVKLVKLAHEFLYSPQCFSLDGLLEAGKLYNDAIRSVAMQRRVPLIDLASAMPGGLEYFHDDSHFTSKGQNFSADFIYREITNDNSLSRRMSLSPVSN